MGCIILHVFFTISPFLPVYVLQMCFKGVQLTKIGPESSVDEPESQLAQKADLCFGSEKPYWMPSGFISPSGGAEMTKEENMTKVL